jgi:hypothetical protein
VKCFDTSTPGIRNSEMESDQWSGTPAFFISVNRHFGIPVVKDLDISNSRYPKLRYVVCDISRLRVSRFRDSCDEESSLLTPPTPGIRNSGMESLSFHDFGFRDFGTPYFPSPGIRLFMMRVFVISISRYPKSRYPILQMESDQWSTISSNQRLRSFRHFAFHDFGTPVDESL